MRKHFQVAIDDERFRYERKQAQIAEEATLDGFYVLRSSVPADTLPPSEVVRSYKQLKQAELAFKTLSARCSRSARSTTGSPSACAPTSSSACSPTT